MEESIPHGKVFTYKESAGVPRDLEVYFPPNHDARSERVPCVLMFHGGGWNGGSLHQFRFLCHYLASRGVVAATANYQLQAGKAACVTDAKSAIRWMKANSNELGLDPERLIVGGGSAGAHISFVASLTPSLDDATDALGQDLSVRAYLLFNPAFLEQEEPAVHAASLVRPGMSPVIAYYGTKDDGQWYRGWQAVYQRMLECGNEQIELWMAEGQPHGFFNQSPWREITAEAADRFLISLRLLAGEPSLPKRAGGEQLFRGSAPE